MGIVLVLVLVLVWLVGRLVGWLVTVGGGRRKEVLQWWWRGIVWCIVEWSVVWVRKKVRGDRLLLLLLLCSE